MSTFHGLEWSSTPPPELPACPDCGEGLEFNSFFSELEDCSNPFCDSKDKERYSCPDCGLFDWAEPDKRGEFTPCRKCVPR